MTWPSLAPSEAAAALSAAESQLQRHFPAAIPVEQVAAQAAAVHRVPSDEEDEAMIGRPEPGQPMEGQPSAKVARQVLGGSPPVQAAALK